MDEDVHQSRLCAAIVDRLTFNGAIIQTGTESYRLAHTKAQAEQAQAGRPGTTQEEPPDNQPNQRAVQKLPWR